jgi:hypothetical protein
MKTYKRTFMTEIGEIDLINYFNENNELDKIEACIVKNGIVLKLNQKLGLNQTDTTKIKKIINFVKTNPNSKF